MSNAKPGRNDPCYCGSGLKYKKCHMQADRELEQERREALTAVRFLRQDLVDFAQDERFAPAFARALERYWNGYYTIETAEEMSDNEAQRFVDWFVFDFSGDEDSERLIETYHRERWDDLSSVQQQVVQQWLDAGPSGAYELVDYQGQTLFLKSFLNGDELEVYEPGGHGNVERGDVILARVLPVQDHLELSGGAAYLPQDEIADLQQKLDEARAADAEENPDASLDDFLRRHNHLLIHHALEQAELNGRPPVSRLEDA
ncbi:MAG: YecA family protein [Chloroflexota bacterium]